MYTNKIIKIEKLRYDNYKITFQDKNGTKYSAYLDELDYKIMLMERKLKELGYDMDSIQEYKELIEKQTSDQCEEGFSERDI